MVHTFWLEHSLNKSLRSIGPKWIIFTMDLGCDKYDIRVKTLPLYGGAMNLNEDDEFLKEVYGMPMTKCGSERVANF